MSVTVIELSPSLLAFLLFHSIIGSPYAKLIRYWNSVTAGYFEDWSFLKMPCYVRNYVFRCEDINFIWISRSSCQYDWCFSVVSPLESNNILSSLLFVSPYQNPIDLEKFGSPNLYVFVIEGKNDSLIQTYMRNSFSSVSLQSKKTSQRHLKFCMIESNFQREECKLASIKLSEMEIIMLIKEASCGLRLPMLLYDSGLGRRCSYRYTEICFHNFQTLRSNQTSYILIFTRASLWCLRSS